ncbi:MAG TPA: AraC family transcriptional regulator [Thermoanaerobaculia bacterium]|nr:AraC family transcriptional regulator [Thermoanaerobaculia bacterium]
MSNSHYRVIYENDAWSIGDYRCHARRGPAGHEEHTDRYEIAFVRRGVFTAALGRSRSLLSPVHAFLLRPGRSFTVEHPTDGGDECTVFRFTSQGFDEVPRKLRDAFREVRVFASPAAFVAQRTLLASLPHADALGIEEQAWQTIASLADDADVAQPTLPSEKMKRAVGTAEELLSARACEALPLRTIAECAGVSRFHLARAFRRITGVSMHRYQTALRLRMALQRLEEGARDLTGLALDLGFSDHSHFCATFHREFRVPPSAYRRLVARTSS